MNDIPTQVRRPWRSTVRTMFQAVVALASLIPFLVAGVYGDGEQVPALVAQVVIVAGAMSRVMALPQVEAFLATFLPFLAAEKHPTEPEYDDTTEEPA